MADKLVLFLQEIIKNDKLLVLIISAFPLIELKGAIPIGTKAGIDLWQSALLGYFGSTLVTIPLFFLLIPVFNLLKKIKFLKKLILKIENVFYNKALKLAEDANKKRGGDALTEEQSQLLAKRVLRNALLAFVAVPFPVTGVWTGTAIAVFLNLDFKTAFPAILIGNLIAGTIITLLTFFFSAYVDLIIYCLLAIAIIMLIVLIIKIALSKPKQE
ncbi:MAG: small multi-drug export protein [Clostridia bacterium]|nr:small multi-drug export protein [Clostridia bacterium]